MSSSASPEIEWWWVETMRKRTRPRTKSVRALLRAGPPRRLGHRRAGGRRGRASAYSHERAPDRAVRPTCTSPMHSRLELRGNSTWTDRRAHRGRNVSRLVPPLSARGCDGRPPGGKRGGSKTSSRRAPASARAEPQRVVRPEAAELDHDRQRNGGSARNRSSDRVKRRPPLAARDGRAAAG